MGLAVTDVRITMSYGDLIYRLISKYRHFPMIEIEFSDVLCIFPTLLFTINAFKSAGRR